ncbi:putative DNA damage repair protein (Rad9) [Aspergillus bombycis]|uniref:Putative DNA damage repair protein (Rad9) n=1 Tax=Aspergillus bombycis TaxID=109264 RepID=A0A1F7ZVW9_9EURO|nr:putative DNA damage repair protein (Rad9) [Aspergillus bombycis]OGM43584.1 putative DNA damage repair protein (Rad9) [Aspergillus bombycis]
METQDDSIDIPQLQRVALGREPAPSQSLIPGSELARHISQDSVVIHKHYSQISNGRQSSTGQEVSRISPSSHPESPSQEENAQSLTNAARLSIEQRRQDPAAGLQLFKKMSSADTVPSDTQVISQSVYDNLIRQNQEAADIESDNNLADNATLRTLHEGDIGHVDLLAGLDGSNTDVTNGDDNEDQSSCKLGESSPMQYQPNLFPESQRFVLKTPATAVKTGSVDDLASVTPTASRNPLATELESSGGIMALSQVFKATQAPSSPLVHGQQLDPMSDRPSPNLPIQNRSLATALSSPLNNVAATFPRDSSEPYPNYITMQESQALRDIISRERMTRSADHIYSEDQSDCEFDKEPSFVERIRRQRNIDEKTRGQLASLSAPPRPASRKNSDKMSKSPSRQPDQRDRADAVRSATPTLEHQENVAAGAISEEETEQEDEVSQRMCRSQDPNPSTEEDKENHHDPSTTPLAAATNAHDRLSQALALDGVPPPNRRRSLQDAAESQLPPHGADDEQLDGTSRSSQVYIVKDSQRSPGPQDEENHEMNNANMWDENQAQASGSHICTKHSPEKLVSPAKQLRIQSTPPSASQRSRVSFQLDNDHVVARSRSNSTSSHGSHEHPLRKSIVQETSLMQSSNSTVHKSIELGDKAPASDIKEKSSSMPSRVAETPVQRPKSFGDVMPATAIPETSPNRFFNQGWAGDANNETMDQEDDDLPPLYSSTHERGYHSQPVNSNSSSPVKSFYNSKILSSPSGRQRRALTEIAADASPQIGTGNFDVDINILSTDDREFRSAVALSPVPPRKRRRGNDGQNVFASDPVLPITPRTATYFAPPKENETMPARDFQPEQSVTTPKGGFEKRSRPSRRAGTVWDVDDSPHYHVSRKERARLFGLPRILEQKAKEALQSEGSTNARLVADQNCSEATSLPTEQHVEVSRDKPSEDLVENNTAREDSVIDGNTEIALNQVLAAWSGTKRAFYPATCFGRPLGTPQSRYLVKFEDSAPVEVPIGAVKRLELRVGDAVKVDMPNVPKVTHIIRGFEGKLSIEDLENEASNGIIRMTDVYGFSTVVLGQKQRKSLTREGLAVPENNVKVPISRIYLDTILWNQLKDRTYSYSSVHTQSESRLQTPSDRHTTPASPSTRLSRSIRYSNGIFAGMVFAVSYGENDESKTRITRMILDNDGRILHDGFNELFDLPSSRPAVTPSKSPTPATSNNQFRLTGGAEDVGFACLIADKHSRRPKYMQALALNLPCLSDRWIEDCIAQRQVIDWEMYLLPAGESSYLHGATKSRLLHPYPAMQARLPETIAARPNLLHGQSVLVVMGRGKADEERRKAYLFLTYALGASKVERVPDIKSARAVLDQGATGTGCEWDWIYVDNDEKASAIATILGASTPGSPKAYPAQRSRKRKRNELTESISGSDLGLNTNVRIVGNEFVCQSLILGRLID